MRRLVLKDGIRMDGRKVTDIRPIWSRAGVLPRTHGSALFTRGETQVRRVGDAVAWTSHSRTEG
jgi:polyribonucleotide nucleotidyltransferase